MKDKALIIINVALIILMSITGIVKGDFFNPYRIVMITLLCIVTYISIAELNKIKSK